MPADPRAPRSTARLEFGGARRGLQSPSAPNKTLTEIRSLLPLRFDPPAPQSLHHFVAHADWSQAALLRQVRTFVLPAIEMSGGVKVWIVDDTGFPKKVVHSVGVARQYCGQLSKQGNCQVQSRCR